MSPVMWAVLPSALDCDYIKLQTMLPKPPDGEDNWPVVTKDLARCKQQWNKINSTSFYCQSVKTWLCVFLTVITLESVIIWLRAHLALLWMSRSGSFMGRKKSCCVYECSVPAAPLHAWLSSEPNPRMIETSHCRRDQAEGLKISEKQENLMENNSVLKLWFLANCVCASVGNEFPFFAGALSCGWTKAQRFWSMNNALVSNHGHSRIVQWVAGI